MLNPITELTGYEFLLFYVVVIAATLLVSWWWARTSDPTAGMPVPAVPREPDPYEIAYLRGGENELTRVVIVALTQRGYLRVVQKEKGWWQSSSDPQIEQQCCPGKVAPSDGKSRPLNVLWPVLPGNDLKSRGRKWSPERSIRTRHNEG